ncbi:STAS domain-containing protein [Antrihabitans spumae]|jgi:anti-sigma B factor antagonist|uniref:Anti-sigma factor antagonist n=1 Tax=Antrihabitans spumae TaxID=3373370 RepID=A0ABW7KD18_9NOCA
MGSNLDISVDVDVTVSTRNATVVRVAGTIDLVTAPVLSEAIERAMAPGPPRVVIDLSAVEFLSAVGMTMLLHAHQSASTRLAVVADGRATSRPMTLLGLDRTLAIYPTLDAALSDSHDREI